MIFHLDISAKIEALDHLWLELNGSLSNRGSLLEETLIKAEQFWTELQKCQKAVDDLRCAIEAIQPATGQPSIIEQQKNTLMVCHMFFPVKIFFIKPPLHSLF